LCHSVKNKKCLNEQCSNKPKINEKLCSKHANYKNVVYFADCNNVSVTNNDNLNNLMLINELKSKDDSDDDLDEINKKIIYTKEQLFDIIQKNKNISVYSLRKSIQNCYLNNFINTKQTKQNLINSIKINIEKNRFYVNNLYYIIKIQSTYRGWNTHKRACCFNDTDILTFDSIYDIPNKYFYIFHDTTTNKKYGYDIRTLNQIIYSDYPSCPYTFRAFTEEEKNKILEYIQYLEYKNIDLCIEKREMTDKEEIDMKIKDVFYQINMLDNYTNPIWFKNLRLDQLINLYILMEDIWSYRTGMTIEAKQNILYNINAFDIPLYIIKSQKSIIKMQHVILNEFIRFITEGINRDERKLGAILILSALVEISEDAAQALPHLIQI
jgi:hypothetical protein